MTRTKSYNLLIDTMRVVAAVFVVAIHTAPFQESSELLSYFVTNVLGRLAVPFFFVLSGYFFFKKVDDRPQNYQNEQFIKSEKNLLKTYGLTIILYLPLWFYLNGFDNISSLPMDILWNGVHYHLWYFIASIVGLAIVFGLTKVFSDKNILIIVGILYLFGSLFNVYTPLLPEAISEPVLSLIGNPRNGIFFAPLFIFMGKILSKQLYKVKPIVSLIVCAIYIAEPLLIYTAGFAVDLNSMYLTLPLVMFVLMNVLLTTKSTSHRSELFHSISLYIYVIHPIMILANRLVIGKILDQTLTTTLNFVLTLILSILVSLAYYTGKQMILREKNE